MNIGRWDTNHSKINTILCPETNYNEIFHQPEVVFLKNSRGSKGVVQSFT